MGKPLLRRVLDRVSDIDSLQKIGTWVGKVVTWYPIWSPIVVGAALVVWAVITGSFGPAFVAIILAAVVVMAAGSVALLNGLDERRVRRSTRVMTGTPAGEQAKPAAATTSVAPSQEDTDKQILSRRIAQGRDLRDALDKKNQYLSKTIVRAIREWGYGTNHALKVAYPGRAVFFIDELPDEDRASRQEHQGYLDRRLAELETIKKERGF